MSSHDAPPGKCQAAAAAMSGPSETASLSDRSSRSGSNPSTRGSTARCSKPHHVRGRRRKRPARIGTRSGDADGGLRHRQRMGPSVRCVGRGFAEHRPGRNPHDGSSAAGDLTRPTHRTENCGREVGHVDARHRGEDEVVRPRAESRSRGKCCESVCARRRRHDGRPVPPVPTTRSVEVRGVATKCWRRTGLTVVRVLGLGSGRTIEAPGGSQALVRSSVVDVELADGSTARVRRPTLVGALLGKVAAVTQIVSQTSAERAKHVRDVDVDNFPAPPTSTRVTSSSIGSRSCCRRSSSRTSK